MPTEPTTRYARQMILPGIGVDGQQRLADAHAMIVGVGALGCTSADLLVRAGVGRVTLIDRDLVERSNLHRQSLFTEQDASDRRPKAAAAEARLRFVNPDVRTIGVVADFNASNAEALIEDGEHGRPDVLVDGTDNFETRYLLNDCSVMLGIPYIYGGAVGTRGMAAAFRPGRTACLRCVFDEAPVPGSQPTCTTAGVLAPVSSIVASMQAAEAIKLLAGADEAVSTDLVILDGWKNTSSRIDLRGARDPDCPCCGRRVFPSLDAPGEPAVTLCGRNAVQIQPAGGRWVDLGAIGESLRTHGEVSEADGFVRGRLEDEGYALTVFRDGRALIEGTEDIGVARAVYDRYIGT
ncbi:MAG: ThiF family adenylyltransferase [Phycisphaerales bacterium]|nr:ThiF family adenylyltransferase [Phycisphaerales bacterium]